MQRPAMSDLVDEQARRRAAQDLDVSVFIEAGAGTGKSSTLVSRIVNTVRRREPRTTIEQVVAITFTDKAGTELRHRLREGLERALAEDPSDGYLQDALDNLDAATVGTIHSFAQSILREHALSAGIPIGFTVVSEATAAAARDGRVRRAVEHVLDGMDTGVASVLRAYGITPDALRALVTRLDIETLKLSDAAFIDDRADMIEPLRRVAMSCVQSYWQHIQDSCLDTEDLLYTKLADILPALLEDLQHADAARCAELLQEARVGPGLPAIGGSGKKQNWSTADPKGLRDDYRTLAAPLTDFCFAPADAALRRVLGRAWEFLKGCRTERAASGMLEFDDLLLLADALLTGDPQVRRCLHRQFRVIMVDEFQDTDPLQWRIVQSITADPDDPKVRPLPGRLVVVGDPKQAIYSFRGADVNTYLQAQAHFGTSDDSLGEVLSLSTNFRSVRPIIEFVNEVFSRAMDSGNSEQVQYSPLIAAHDPQDPSPGRTVLVVRDAQAGPGDDAKYPSTRMEPRQIAYAISQAITQGWKVTVPTGPRDRAYTRRAQFSDITILYPARTGRSALLEALDEFNIPFRSADAGLVYDRPVVLGARAMLHYAAEGLADLNLWLALKSPIFGLNDRQLLDHRLAGGRWFSHQDNPPGPVSEALGVLSEVRRRARGLTVVELLDWLIDTTGIWQALPLAHRGNFEADCLRMFRAHAQQWQDEGGVDLGEYVQWVQEVVANAHRTALPEPDDREDNAVRLMTTYQAKGLEFPIVALAGMSHAPGSHEPMLGVVDSNEFELRLSPLYRSAGYPTWYESEYLPRERAEDTRVMYVAFTRARDHLIVSLAGERSSLKAASGEPLKRQPYASLLWPSMAPGPDDLFGLPEHVEPFVRQPDPPIEPIAADWDLRLAAARDRSRVRWVASPSGHGARALGIDTTAEGADEIEDEVELDGRIVPEPGTRRARGDGSAIGSSVHRSLDILVREPDAAPDRVRQVCQQMAADEEALDSLETITSMVHAALGSQTIAAARGAEGLWTELYLAAGVDHQGIRVIDGLADLVFRDTEGIHIIDYKTDAVIDQTNLPDYREQLLAYAELMHRATGGEPISTALLHLSEGSSRLIPIS